MVEEGIAAKRHKRRKEDGISRTRRREGAKKHKRRKNFGGQWMLVIWKFVFQQKETKETERLRRAVDVGFLRDFFRAFPIQSAA